MDEKNRIVENLVKSHVVLTDMLTVLGEENKRLQVRVNKLESYGVVDKDVLRAQLRHIVGRLDKLEPKVDVLEEAIIENLRHRQGGQPAPGGRVAPMGCCINCGKFSSTGPGSLCDECVRLR